MRPGISLLDVVVALAIASVLSLLLYRSLYQTNRTVGIVDALVEANTQLVFFGDRLMKDVSGAFVPLQAVKKSKEKGEKGQKPGEEKNLRNPDRPLRKAKRRASACAIFLLWTT